MPRHRRVSVPSAGRFALDRRAIRFPAEAVTLAGSFRYTVSDGTQTPVAGPLTGKSAILATTRSPAMATKRITRAAGITFRRRGAYRLFGGSGYTLNRDAGNDCWTALRIDRMNGGRARDLWSVAATACRLVRVYKRSSGMAAFSHHRIEGCAPEYARCLPSPDNGLAFQQRMGAPHLHHALNLRCGTDVAIALSCCLRRLARSGLTGAFDITDDSPETYGTPRRTLD